MSRVSPLRAGSAGARVCPGGGSGDVGAIDAADRCSRVPGAVVTAITQHEKPCPDARARQGRSMVHTRPCPASVGTAESCGKVILVATMGLLPCAQPPSPHMGARPPRTMIIRKAHHSNKKQHPPRKDPALPCATPKTPTPTRHATPHTTNPPQTRTGIRPISTRRCTDLGTGYDRSRRGEGGLCPGGWSGLCCRHRAVPAAMVR